MGIPELGVGECTHIVFAQVFQLISAYSSLLERGEGGPLELFLSLNSQRFFEAMLVVSLTKHLFPIHSVVRIPIVLQCALFL